MKIQRKKTTHAVQRIRSVRGVSLVEMLMATLILSLATLVIVQCVSLASRHFVSQTRESEAQMLCSALVVAIQDELLYAQEIEGSGTSFTYFSGSRRQGQKSTLKVIDGKVYVVPNKGDKIPLVEDASYAAGGRRGVSGTGAFLKAKMTTTLNKVDDVAQSIEIDLKISGSDDKELSSAKFSVKPLAPGAK